MRTTAHTFTSYNKSGRLPNDEAIENLAKRFQKLIEDAKKNKVMFSVSYHIDVFKRWDREELSIIDYSILVLDRLMNKDANVTKIGRSKLMPLWSEMSDLVSKGNNVSEEASKKLQGDILQNRKSHLSTLKQIVSDSIENGDKEDVKVKRDNAFYCVKCPEKSVITPAKFMNFPEFKDLEYGALKIGNDVIRIQNGQYCDMKGKVKMTFKVSDSEKIEMILSSEKAESFGKIMVHMDDKSCEIFLKYLKELEKEPRISKVVEVAKSFVQNKSPLSSIDDANVQQLQSNVESLQSSGQSLG
ncbi:MULTISPECIES: hypothetical protein [unclassified Wolbachia]|uniref:hypothetical protein n=1 Tax=unclassified Wolbachia TaxID=2640676 RepID=UPI00223176BC|nr:hypothetical protein [Wolbachia endosymbiont (group A) of Apoderus coryli]